MELEAKLAEVGEWSKRLVILGDGHIIPDQNVSAGDFINETLGMTDELMHLLERGE